MNTEQGTLRGYWQQHIERFQHSGLSGMRYCAREGLTYHCFTYWRHKLSAARTEGSGTGREPVSGASGVSSGFVSVRSATRVSPSSVDTGLELSLPNGLVIGNIRANNLSLVGALLGQL